MKLGRNDPCWCGSGLKFKKCHLEREREKPLPTGAIMDEANKAFIHKKCFHPRASSSTCGKVIDAHTIQRSTTLNALIDDRNELLTFYPMDVDRDGALVLHTVGWHKASTFKGFCANHDNTLFASIEQRPFDGNLEQSFMLGYRSICHEIYQKEGALRTKDIFRKKLDRGLPKHIQEIIQHKQLISEAGTRHGLESYRKIKSLMDDQLLSKNYTGWSRVTIHFEGDLCITSTGIITPNRDLNGKVLQVLHDPDSELQPLMASVIANSNGGTISFIYRSDHDACDGFITSLLSTTPDKLPSLIVQMFFVYIENTFFSSKWWSSLSEEHRDQIRLLAGITNAYYTNYDFSTSKLVPWNVLSVEIDH